MKDLKRYKKQILLSGFGIEAQQKLAEAKVLVIGAGGLGCPVLQYLTIAGIGTIGIADFDSIDYSNLHRQFLYDESSVGKHKVIIAKEKLQLLNSEVKFELFIEKITNQNALEIISKYDVVVDGTDNFQTRYIVNDACVLLDKPLVYGSLFQYEGQISVFNVANEQGLKTNYRDLFPVPPRPEEVPNCNEAGVLGVLSGMIGTMQANEVIKILTGIGEVMSCKLLIYNLLNCVSQIFYYSSSEQNTLPKSEAEFLKMDYEQVCGISQVFGIQNYTELEELLNLEKSVVIDVRNNDEIPKITIFNTIVIPLNILDKKTSFLEQFDTIIFICQSGVRSLKAVQLLQNKFPEKKITHVENGIYTILDQLDTI